MNEFFYISSGAGNKMYTLRLHTEDGLDYYCCNLSTDREKAHAKAKEMADGKLLGSPLQLGDLNEYDTGVAERERQEREEREAATKAAEEERINRQLDLVGQGRMPFGKHVDCELQHVPYDYVRFWVFEKEKDDGVVCEAIREAFIRLRPEVVALPTPNGEYVGEIKQRLEFDATCVASFGFHGFYGYTYIEKFVSSEGHSLTYMGSSYLGVNPGDKVRLKGTVKKHEEYKGEPSTHLSRVKIL